MNDNGVIIHESEPPPMDRPPYSPATIKALVDVVTGGSGTGGGTPIGIYRKAFEIERLMMDCDLDFRVGNSSRLPALADFLRTLLGEQDGAAKLDRVALRVSEADDYLDKQGLQEKVIAHLNRFLARDGRQIVLHGDRPQLTLVGKSGAVVGSISAKAATLDFDTVQRDIKRALDSAENDPEDAVTAACSVIESVCRSILIELKLPLPSKKDIDGLVRAVQEPLGLSPGRSDLPDEIAADVRQVLGGLTTTAKGIGALRTHAGDAHGRERGFKRIDGRIARLAIHGASTLALFLIETWELRQRRPLPQAAEARRHECDTSGPSAAPRSRGAGSAR